MEKKFDIIGIGTPCVDYCLGVEQLPKPDQGSVINFGTWQGGGMVATGLVSASRLGLKTSLLGSVGDDLFGKYAVADLADNGVEVSRVRAKKGIHTDMAVVLSDRETNGRSIIYRYGGGGDLPADELDCSCLEEGDFLFINHVGEVQLKAAKYAKEHGIKVLIDAGYGDLGYYAEIMPCIDYFVASSFMYKAVFGDEIRRENLEKLRGMGAGTVVFTLGGRGAVGLDDKEWAQVPAFNVPVVDTLGAGDVFHGAFFYGIKKGLSLKDTITFASAVSAIKCTVPGGRAGIPTEEMTLSFLKDGVIPEGDLAERRERYAWGMPEFNPGGEKA